MIKFTPSAIERFKTVVDASENVRVAVVGGGCSGLSYQLDIQDEFDDEDILINLDSVKVYIDPYSASILEDTTVDFVKRGLNEGFVFNNPKSNTTCGCGMSFS